MLDLSKTIVIDTETTGLAKSDEVISLGFELAASCMAAKCIHRDVGAPVLATFAHAMGYELLLRGHGHEMPIDPSMTKEAN